MLNTRHLVYSDLNCPFCFVLNEWLCEAHKASDVRWIGVEHEPEIPVGGLPTVHGRSELIEEVARARERAPRLLVQLPLRRPNSRLALTAVAYAQKRLGPVSAGVRTALFRALWHDGADLEDEMVVLGTLKRFDLTPNIAELGLCEETVVSDSAQWLRSAFDRIPVLVAPSGQQYLGLGNRLALETFFGAQFFSLERNGACRRG